MLDFPASPTNGQLFTGANGVIYQWSSVGGLWLNYGVGMNNAIINSTPPSNPVAGQLWWSPDLGRLFIYYNDGNSSQWVPADVNVAQQATAPGDFFAYGATIPTTGAVLVFPNVLTGNSGGWYNTSTGRFTPPAGRYRIAAGFSGANSAAASNLNISLFRNGSSIGSTFTTTGAAAFEGNVAVESTVDANGTDFFDSRGSMNPALNSGAGLAYFSAVPVGVISYTTPAPGNLYLYSEQVLSVAGNDLRVSIPSNARLVQLEWGATSVGAVNDTLLLQMIQSGTPLTAANYETQNTYGSVSTASAGQNSGQVGWNMGGAVAWVGGWKTSWLPSAVTGFTGGFVFGYGQSYEMGSGGLPGRVNANYSTYYNASISGGLASITGFRLAPNTSNLAIGSYLRAFVVQ